MSQNSTSIGYFMKRLRDSGYRVEKLYTHYSEMDARRWTVVIDPDKASVFCTCYENYCDLNETFFEIYDGGQYLPTYKIKTESIDVLLEHLNKYGIFNKE